MLCISTMAFQGRRTLAVSTTLDGLSKAIVRREAMEMIDSRDAPLTPDLHELGAFAATCARRASSQVEKGVRVARWVWSATLAQMHHRAAEGGAYVSTSLKRKCGSRCSFAGASGLYVKSVTCCDIACHFFVAQRA